MSKKGRDELENITTEIFKTSLPIGWLDEDDSDVYEIEDIEILGEDELYKLLEHVRILNILPLYNGTITIACRYPGGARK